MAAIPIAPGITRGRHHESGGTSAAVTMVPGGPVGYLALRLDRRTVQRIAEIKGAPMVAIGVYDDAQRLIDATGVHT